MSLLLLDYADKQEQNWSHSLPKHSLILTPAISLQCFIRTVLVDDQTAALIGLGLFAASEAIGMSKYRSNSVLQLVLQIARRAFPYEVRRIEEHPPERGGLFHREAPQEKRKDHRRRRDG